MTLASARRSVARPGSAMHRSGVTSLQSTIGRTASLEPVRHRRLSSRSVRRLESRRGPVPGSWPEGLGTHGLRQFDRPDPVRSAHGLVGCRSARQAGLSRSGPRPSQDQDARVHGEPPPARSGVGVVRERPRGRPRRSVFDGTPAWVSGILDWSTGPDNTNVIKLIDPRYGQLADYVGGERVRASTPRVSSRRICPGGWASRLPSTPAPSARRLPTVTSSSTRGKARTLCRAYGIPFRSY
jgi:hypothetical protein